LYFKHIANDFLTPVVNVFIQNLRSDAEARQPQLDSLVAAGRSLESEAGDSGISEMEYDSAQGRYDKLKVLCLY